MTSVRTWFALSSPSSHVITRTPPFFQADVARIVGTVDASHWFVVSDTGIARTTDAGKHWATISGWPSDEHASTLEFENTEIGWAEVVVGSTHPTLAIYRTTDGGAHWTRFGVPSLS